LIRRHVTALSSKHKHFCCHATEAHLLHCSSRRGHLSRASDMRGGAYSDLLRWPSVLLLFTKVREARNLRTKSYPLRACMCIGARRIQQWVLLNTVHSHANVNSFRRHCPAAPASTKQKRTSTLNAQAITSFGMPLASAKPIFLFWNMGRLDDSPGSPSEPARQQQHGASFETLRHDCLMP